MEKPCIYILISTLVYLALFSCKEVIPEHETWEVYSGDSKGTKYSSLDQIDKEN